MENLSVEEFKLPDDFSDELSECLHQLFCKFNIPPEKVTVEIFENTVVDLEGVQKLFAISPPRSLKTCKCYSNGCAGKPRRGCKQGQCWDCR